MEIDQHNLLINKLKENIKINVSIKKTLLNLATIPNKNSIKEILPKMFIYYKNKQVQMEMLTSI